MSSSAAKRKVKSSRQRCDGNRWQPSAFNVKALRAAPSISWKIRGVNLKGTFDNVMNNLASMFPKKKESKNEAV